MTLLVKWLILALAIFAVGKFLPGIHVTDFTIALWAAVALGILNTIIRPILKLLAFPITLLTLGLFALVINGFMFWLATKFVTGFTVDGFWWAVLAALLVSVITMILERVFLGRDGKVGGE